MKVSELIIELEKLHPDKDIWLIYDTCFAFVPSVDVIENPSFNIDPAQIGDYGFFVG